MTGSELTSQKVNELTFWITQDDVRRAREEHDNVIACPDMHAMPEGAMVLSSARPPAQSGAVTIAGAIEVLRDAVCPDGHAVSIVFDSQEKADRFHSQLSEAMQSQQNIAGPAPSNDEQSKWLDIPAFLRHADDPPASIDGPRATAPHQLAISIPQTNDPLAPLPPGHIAVPVVLPALAVSEIKDHMCEEYGLSTICARPLWAELLGIVAGLSIEQQEECAAGSDAKTVEPHSQGESINASDRAGI